MSVVLKRRGSRSFARIAAVGSAVVLAACGGRRFQEGQGPSGPSGPDSGRTSGGPWGGDSGAFAGNDGSGDAGGQGTGAGAPGEAGVPGTGSAGPTPLRRLTLVEYNNTVRDLLGDP